KRILRCLSFKNGRIPQSFILSASLLFLSISYEIIYLKNEHLFFDGPFASVKWPRATSEPFANAQKHKNKHPNT
ncbi:MAG: hypothetical protein QE271_00105, partial [Bacteriovoracaceae bacterium]|nr:hypothetical protein [Bacteriovoracaceae bacterium]